jgi:hypothetical protein
LLAACPPTRYGALRFALTPAHRRLDSRWPLGEIWRVHADGYDTPMAIDFARGSQVLVVRRAQLVYVDDLSPAEAALWDTFAGAGSLEQAAVRALACEPNFDFGAALRRWCASGLIIGVHLSEGESQ